MSQSIKLSDEEMDILREEAKVSSRSVAGQAAHWLRIGRMIEKSPSFSYQRIRDSLKGLISPDELSAEEQIIDLDEFSSLMWEVTPEQEAFFEERKKTGKGVGLDKTDNLIYQSESKKRG